MLEAINIATYNQLEADFGEILVELKAAFIEDGFQLLAQIEQAIQQSDTDTLHYAAHTLKSSARNIGADPLADYCDVLEQTQLPEANAPSLYEQAQAQMQAAVQFLTSR
ncbi:MAG: Hpt domain-containing protein [bacterium]